MVISGPWIGLPMIPRIRVTSRLFALIKALPQKPSLTLRLIVKHPGFVVIQFKS